MKKIIFSLIVLLTLTVVSESQPANHQKQSLFKGVFALTWLGGFCKLNYNNCDKIKYGLWDRQSFTIHGLWPSAITSKKDKAKNQNVILNIDTKLIDEMQNFWPPEIILNNKRVDNLWVHQYKTHGIDFNQHLKRLYPEQYSAASDKALQSKYFSSAIGFYERLKLHKLRRALVDLYISPTQKVVLRKNDLSKIMDISTDKFILQCSSKNSQQLYLWQIKICFEVSSQQDRLKIKSSICPSKDIKYHKDNQDSVIVDCENLAFTLIDFDWSNLQRRVTNKLVNNSEQEL